MTNGSVYTHEDFKITLLEDYTFKCRFFMHKNDPEKKFFVCYAVPEESVDHKSENFSENFRITSPAIGNPFLSVKEKIALALKDKTYSIDDITIYIYDPTGQTFSNFIFLELHEDYLTTTFDKLHLEEMEEIQDCLELTKEDLNFE